jgi:hypothetical protein
MVALQKSGKSAGERDVIKFPSITAGSSMTFAPAFLRSVLTEGQLVMVLSLTIFASMST